MAEDIQTTVQFQADITDFKGAMQEANRAVKLANSEFKAASSGMDDWGGSTDGLSAKLRQLTAVHDAEQRKLDVLKTAYAKVVEEQGENSAAAVELQTKINNQQAVVNKAQKEHEKYAQKLEDVENAADDAASDIEDAGDAAKDAGDAAKDGKDGWTILKDVIADFVKDTIKGAVDALTSLAEATREYRRDMAQLAQNASDAGQDMGAVSDVLADVASVTGETDAAMEGLNMLLATGMDTDNLTNAAEAFAGAATKFDGLKFEGLAEGLQETLAVGSAVGPFAELIERTGGDLEKFNEGMAACTTAAERQQYAMQWLNESGLKDIHDSYVQNNADLVEAEKAQFRYNDAMAKVGAAIEPINTGLANIRATILEKIAPVVENVVQWVLDNLPVIGPIITGIAAALGVLAVAMGIQSLIKGVTSAFALLNTTMLANPIVLIVALIAGLVTAFVGLWNNCEGFRNFFISMWEGIKTAVSAVVDWLGDAVSSIGDFFSDAWEGIKGTFSNVGGFFKNTFSNAWENTKAAFTNPEEFFSGVWDKAKSALSSVGGWFKNTFSNAWENTKAAFTNPKEFFSGVRDKVQNALSGVDSWMGSKFGNAWDAVKNQFSNVTSFFSGVWDKIKNAFSGALSGMKDVGGNMIQGLWDGISNSFTWIKDKISGWVGNVMDFIKGLFGIHSPSTVFRDEVGKMLGLGMAEGIEDSRNAVNGAVRKLGNAAVGGLSTGSGGGATAAAGGRSIVFNQYNNSPKALSRREIYRQTHNALAYAGGA